ncbi:VOC family protein [Agromyces atrinae]|uniref:VOC family protein n=1 Tax=Agromyces atrinae TaxID=592376 RepID=UPI001F565754|nr:VOC family protein [Agromyces atrinae]MCI2956117.1 VOC family protein [Agromyces atrinae]
MHSAKPSSSRSHPSRTGRWIAGGAVAALLLAGAGAWWLVAGSADAGPLASPTSTGSPEGPALTGVLPDATEMGAVELAVTDLDATAAYYRDAIGLTVLEESDTRVVLGHDTPLIQLDASDGGADDPRTAGLYHSAILFADAPSLAATLQNIAEKAPQSYQGSADHAVSLAFYFGDPEGNGVELYVDRPRDEWVWQDGQVVMGSEALDPNAFIEQNLSGDATGDAQMGHVHLRVGDVGEARAFYADVLGFDVTAESDGAIFYSAGGYHHHLATNSWQSAGAGPRGDGAGLRALTIRLPQASDLDAVAARLVDADVAHELADDVLVTADPWGNTIRFITL